MLSALRNALPHKRDRENISFIAECILTDKLYRVRIADEPVPGVSAEMYGFIQGGSDVDGGEASPAKAGADQIVRTAGWRRRRGDALSTKMPWLDKLLSDPEVCRLLSDSGSWSFDVWALNECAGQHTMAVLVVHFVQAYELDTRLGIDMPSLVRFVSKLQQGYHDVPFHNYVHACDVVHGAVFFLTQQQVRRHLSPLDMYALILAAAAHDHGHEGLSNAFYCNSGHELALRYNDASVLEMHHISSAWRLLALDGCDALMGLSSEQCGDLRQTMVEAVLGTDMKLHFDHLAKFKALSSSGAFDQPDRGGVRKLLTMCLHAADISNPCKPWRLSSRWAARVMTEFFLQGDREAEMGIPVSPFMDRERTDIAQAQAGFISVLIQPFFEVQTTPNSSGPPWRGPPHRSLPCRCMYCPAALQEWTEWLGERVQREVMGHVAASLKLYLACAVGGGHSGQASTESLNRRTSRGGRRRARRRSGICSTRSERTRPEVSVSNAGPAPGSRAVGPGRGRFPGTGGADRSPI